ncbi:MAG: Holliday junction resolvase RuvX [Fretibacterium sp.]|nr:Holliday junction resolvase RuvX [Fretibacterium sp.]
MSQDPPKGRILALDIGSVRVGAAITDPTGVIAQALAVWPVEGDNRGGRGWRFHFEECLKRYDPVLVLLGLPRRTDGTLGPEAERISSLVEKLRARHPDRTFELWDERFTTTLAQRALLEADVSRKKRREHVDKVAATLILQSWLESAAAKAFRAPSRGRDIEATTFRE